MAYRVLIVDDSPAMRTFVRRVAELSGIEVERYFQAANGEEALALLQREPVDVVLTDVNMPRMNGEELLRNLEADERFRNVPVLVISTDGTETRVHRMMALGAKGYVKKPFLPEILREELERVLGARDEN
ncbi:MAG TPA: response regulator [Bryobacteraceae bacterium]|nr:response regulator [Bryobacteraceae bacterium]